MSMSTNTASAATMSTITMMNTRTANAATMNTITMMNTNTANAATMSTITTMNTKTASAAIMNIITIMNMVIITQMMYLQAGAQKHLSALSNTTDYGFILRAKGMVPETNGDWLHFDLTPGEYEIRHGAADYTGKLCVIGTDIKEDSLKELFGLN